MTRKSNKTSWKIGPNKGLFGDKHPSWKGGFDYKKYQKEYHKKNESSYPEYQKKYMQRVRLAVVEALGAKCVRCNFDDIRALQIDHINGGGSKERKNKLYKGNFHSNVLKSFMKKENKYQLLCANCNWIKRVENNERNK